ncbi:aromatic-ring-hydroxylating dioxygenase subunit beta [Sulfuracidifex tepidarius]|uniref:3-phenylpropionate/cinnamic acid dioxygenase subunit beta n=1 Tax=Sulfuracidifex tepidarius TaxID=1294262 RepID=A0A510E6Y8_9CREN|nr:aromatic-ring-hydroxylating dioxygenase subunit beta [Sulfuracidifex tepidarius]BBG24995.1 3-phenylpropionate/cinnamic acid dioxygenase subunit beta [Sulfuracidifex tepidarius]BBG27780.1 3-phenylpropionate/cinnamic acid dioxygenase subunit beta [Sulfuracidifex tepidarius]
MICSELDCKLKDSVVNFLVNEMKLLEEGKCEEWLTLLTDDVSYTMETTLNSLHTKVEGKDISIFRDNKMSLSIRCEKSRTAYDWIETPPSKVRYHPSKVIIKGDQREVEVETSLLVYVYRNGKSQVISMLRKDTLSFTDGKLMLRRRKIEFDADIPDVVFSRIL